VRAGDPRHQPNSRNPKARTGVTALKHAAATLKGRLSASGLVGLDVGTHPRQESGARRVDRVPGGEKGRTFRPATRRRGLRQ
jgi:hypothetical protein